MLHPNQFQVNEAWIVFKLNDAPLTTTSDGDFNVIALMDAASCFLLATEFVPTQSPEPSQAIARQLLAAGEAHKEQLAKTLFVPASLTADELGGEASSQGLDVVRVDDAELQVFIGEAREGFKERFGSGSLQ